MSWLSLRHRLEQLPLVIAGPILRRTETDGVTVWVALQAAAKVTLKVYLTKQGKEIESEKIICQGERSTAAIGKYLHIVAITARTLNSNLEPGYIYAYDLEFEVADSEGTEKQTLQQALTTPSYSPDSISYFEHGWPTFVLPPLDLNKLRIAHGSCRKPQGEGQDALPILDDAISQAADDPDFRVHQLFLTGDQIYGDDVADALLLMLTDAGDTLLGWQENLPHTSEKTNPKHLKPSQRSETAETKAGLTAGLDQPERAKSHLFSFGEYCAAYLFVWSPVLWPPQIPTAKEISQNAKVAKKSKGELKELQRFVHTLAKVRRLLANVATYMIFDDHDITDDWYLNQAWCLRVLGKPLGRKTVQNGLLAYALFQAWGNTPEQFAPGEIGEKLLNAAEIWSNSEGQDSSANLALSRYLGLPPQDSVTGLPKMRHDGNVLILERDLEALTWHYTLRFQGYELIILDTRTWRGYPDGEQPAKAPPMLLSPSAFEKQINQPLEQSDHLCREGLAQIDLTIIIAPTNLVSLQIIDQIQHHNLRQRKVYNNDVGDAWNIHKSALAKLLKSLFERRKQVIVLSGDIHYGSAVRFNYWEYSRNPSKTNLEAKIAPRVLAQLTASAFCNSELKTRLVHTKLKSLIPEPTRQWVGWDEPLDLIEVKKPQELKANQWSPAPDWSYQIEWIKRQPAKTFKRDVSWLKADWQSSSDWSSRLKNFFFLLWRNRWLHEGKEVVGRNNFGLVSFNFSDEAILNIVTQDLYWCPPWKLTNIVYSRYSLDLRLKE